MEEILDSILLGIVQGLTEFLPVSSSGHLVLAQELLGTNLGQGILFKVAVHIATLFAILIFYRRRVAQLFYGAVTRNRSALEYIAKLALGTLPAGYGLSPWISIVVGGAFLFGFLRYFGRKSDDAV